MPDPGELKSRWLAGRKLFTDEVDVDGDRLPLFNASSKGNASPADMYTAMHSVPYPTGAVAFDGSTFLSAVALAAADNGDLSFSLWWRPNAFGVSGQDDLWSVDKDDQFTSGIYLNSDATYLEVDNFNRTIRFFNDSVLANPELVWLNVLGSIRSDLAAGLKVMHLYVNGVNAISALFDDGAAFNTPINGKPFFVGAGNAISSGDMADFWFAPGQFIDFSLLANRRKFITKGNRPVDLGADGSAPTGVAPAVFLRATPGDEVATFPTNLGDGGDFTVTGALTVAASSPSD